MVQSLNVSGIVNAFRLLWNPSLAVPHLIVNGTCRETIYVHMAAHE